MSAFIEKIIDNLLKNPIISFPTLLFLGGMVGSLNKSFHLTGVSLALHTGR